MSDLTSFTLGFLLNAAAATIIARAIYYPQTHDKRYVFTYLAFNTVVYFVFSLMSSITIGIGVGFGLFAIFRVLRYRTDPMPVREMTYLFVFMALPIMNSAGMLEDHWPQLLIADAATVLLLWVLEKEWGFAYEVSKRITYEKIDLIVPERQSELLADLKARTGLNIRRVQIGKIDFLHDTADLLVFCGETGRNGWDCVPAIEEQPVELSEP